MCEGRDLPYPRRPCEAVATGAAAESGPRLKHRQSIMRNNIAGKKIPCKPQKLQEILVTMKIRCGRQELARQALIPLAGARGVSLGI